MPSSSRFREKLSAARRTRGVSRAALLALAALFGTAGIAVATTVGPGDARTRAAVYTTAPTTTAGAPPAPAPPAPPPPPDKTFAGAALSGGSSATVKRGLVSFTLKSPEDSTGTISLATAKAVQVSARKKVLKLGSKSFKLTANKATVVKVKVSRKGLKAFRRGKLKAKATITGTDAAGNKKVTTKSLTLKLAKAKRKRK